ncbi:MAG: hypothetical protein ABI885_20915 [Gammaproteobacteria bacterium]
MAASHLCAGYLIPATTLQTEMRDHLLDLWRRWDDAAGKRIAAVNFFRAAPSAQRQAEIRALKNEVGECTDAGQALPENWMRGQFNMTCAKGIVGLFFTLTTPRVCVLTDHRLQRRIVN